VLGIENLHFLVASNDSTKPEMFIFLTLNFGRFEDADKNV
jgi:hypothetical protein